MKKLFLLLLFVSLQAQGTELTDAMRKNDRQKVEQLLAQSPTIVAGIIDAPDSSSNIPLHYAVENNKKEFVHLLLAKGAAIDKPNHIGHTPLRLTVMGNNKELARLLLNKGTDVDAPDSNGRTPLHVAILLDNKELVQPLLQYGADPFVKDAEAKTALDILLTNTACTPEKKQQIRELVEPYMAVFKEVQQNPTIDTLKKAVQLGYPALVKQLLKKVKPGIRQVRQLSQLAHQRSAQTKNEAFKTIKRMLTDYMHALMLAHTESPLPVDILHVIAGYTV